MGKNDIPYLRSSTYRKNIFPRGHSTPKIFELVGYRTSAPRSLYVVYSTERSSIRLGAEKPRIIAGDRVRIPSWLLGSPRSCLGKATSGQIRAFCFVKLDRFLYQYKERDEFGCWHVSGCGNCNPDRHAWWSRVYMTSAKDTWAGISSVYSQLLRRVLFV